MSAVVVAIDAIYRVDKFAHWSTRIYCVENDWFLLVQRYCLTYPRLSNRMRSFEKVSKSWYETIDECAYRNVPYCTSQVSWLSATDLLIVRMRDASHRIPPPALGNGANSGFLFARVSLVVAVAQGLRKLSNSLF